MSAIVFLVSSVLVLAVLGVVLARLRKSRPARAGGWDGATAALYSDDGAGCGSDGSDGGSCDGGGDGGD